MRAFPTGDHSSSDPSPSAREKVSDQTCNFSIESYTSSISKVFHRSWLRHISHASLCLVSLPLLFICSSPRAGYRCSIFVPVYSLRTARIVSFAGILSLLGVFTSQRPKGDLGDWWPLYFALTGLAITTSLSLLLGGHIPLFSAEALPFHLCRQFAQTSHNSSGSEHPNVLVASRSTSEESLLFTCIYSLLCGSSTQLLFSCRIHQGFPRRTTHLCSKGNNGHAGQRWKLEPGILAVLCQSSRDTCICAPAITAFPWR